MAETKFGVSQIKVETPGWATWMFRITFLLTTVLCAWIAATNIFPQGTKYEVTIFLKLVIDPFIWGLSKMFGISLKDDDANRK